MLRDVVTREVDPHLFALSYDYVGDLGETIALIWPHHGEQEDLPSLTELIELFNTTSKRELPALIAALLTRAAINERWALVKLATGALRIGLSARLAKTALAADGRQGAAGDRGNLARARNALRRAVRLARRHAASGPISIMRRASTR